MERKTKISKVNINVSANLTDYSKNVLQIHGFPCCYLGFIIFYFSSPTAIQLLLQMEIQIQMPHSCILWIFRLFAEKGKLKIWNSPSPVAGRFQLQLYSNIANKHKLSFCDSECIRSHQQMQQKQKTKQTSYFPPCGMMGVGCLHLALLLITSIWITHTH